MATFGPKNTTRADNSTLTQTVTNGGVAITGRGKNSKTALGDVITVGKRGQLSIVNNTTVTGATQDDLANLQGKLTTSLGQLIGSGGGGVDAGAYLPQDNGAPVRWVAIGLAVVVVAVLWFYKRK